MNTLVKNTKTSANRPVEMSSDELLEQLRHSPQLAFYLQELQRLFADEQKKRVEFYELITPQDKAEFINGEIVWHSPVKLKHNRVSRRLFALLDAYVAAKDLGELGYEKLMISLTRNDYEPDICFFSKAKTAVFNDDQWQFPAPDFIVEVLSDSTAANDRGVKFTDYAAHGVSEYWLIDPTEQIVEQYRLSNGKYELVQTKRDGMIRSLVVNGFEIPVAALFNTTAKNAALQQIMALTVS
jgi:Uma2 family endonuclease